MNAELPLGLPPVEAENSHEAALTHLLRDGGPRSADDIEVTADAAIAAYGGDAKALVKALLLAYATMTGEAERLAQLVSRGYTRGGVDHLRA
jgi:hypothetical protein